MLLLRALFRTWSGEIRTGEDMLKSEGLGFDNGMTKIESQMIVGVEGRMSCASLSQRNCGRGYLSTGTKTRRCPRQNAKKKFYAVGVTNLLKFFEIKYVVL